VETLPTVTEFVVTPVWSLKAVAGIFELPPVPPLPDPVVVVVDDELVELQAIAVEASSRTMPAAASRVIANRLAT
jgi:hypothetical protein